MSTFPSNATKQTSTEVRSQDWLKEEKQEEVCQRATNWRRLVEVVVRAAREKESMAQPFLPVKVLKFMRCVATKKCSKGVYTKL